MFPSQKWRPSPDSARGSPGFNEAGMFPSQKYLADLGVEFDGPASMRPGCFHPRNIPLPKGTCSTQWCFNEAGMFPSQK